MAIPVSKQLNEAINDYKKVIENTFNTEGSSRSYCAYIRSIENGMRGRSENASFTLLNNWILPQLAIKDDDKNKNKEGNIDENEDVDITWDLLENVLEEFDKAFKEDQQGQEITHIRKHPKSKCRSALASFAKYILGMYKANLYLSLEQKTDEENCRIVARNALFCTVEIANKVRDGNKGSDINKRHTGGTKGKGNMYYSWYCYKYQRKTPGQKVGTQINMPSQLDPESMGKYILDSNNYAALAIKYAVIEGLPNWLKATYRDFEDYMACHIWDKSCYDYRYHTSVFNLVLLPKSVGGLSDYCDAVKEILQYEAAMRFGVYPDGYSYAMSPATQKIYAKLHNEWRQPDEHQIALANIKAGMIPKAL